MSVNRYNSAGTAARAAAGAVLFALLAALPSAAPPQAMTQSPDRLEPRTRPAQPLELAVTLGDLWNIQSSEKVKATGEEISRPGYRMSGWHPAVVPSTVLGTLVQNNVYRDVFFGRNLESVPTAPFDVPWWYRKEFTVPMAPGLTRFSLEFDGVNYRANIWLNGKRIADAATVFGPYRRFALDVTADVKRTEKNVLAVEVMPPQKGEPAIGWVDWNPAPPDGAMGLFREVRVRATGDVSIESPFVVTRLELPSLATARLTVSAELVNHAEADVSGTLQGQIEGLRFSREVDLRPGERRTVVFTPEATPELVLAGPRVWWTHDLGKPELYLLELSFVLKKGRDAPPPPAAPEPSGDQGEPKPKAREEGLRRMPGMPRVMPSDLRTVRFGVREVGDFRTPEGHRGFTLNGRKILVRGAGWTDDLLLESRPRRLAAEVLYVRHMNLNAIRLEGFWGTSEALYDLCDRNGILIMAGWSCHWEWPHLIGKPAGEPYGGITSPEDIDLVAASWRDQILWLRNHPSVFVWVQASDLLPHPDLERRYVDIHRELDPTRPTLVSAKGKTSRLTGPSGVKMLGPYDWVPPSYWYVDTKNGGAYGFNTESGPGPQVPPLESLRRMIPEDKLWPAGEDWEFHASRGKFQDLARYNEAMDRRLGAPGDLEDYLRKAQFLNYEGMRAMFEAFVANRPGATGVIQWMLNAAWPKLWWQLYDYFLQPNGAFYGARKANQPVHLAYDYGTGEVVAVNAAREAAPKLKATVRLLDFGLGEIIAKTVDFGLAADEVRAIDTVRLPPDSKKVCFLDLRVFRDKGQLVDANFYCLPPGPETLDEAIATWFVTPVKRYADLAALNDLRPVAVKVRGRFNQDGPQTRVTVDLENPSPDLAFMIEVRVVRQATGEPVLPVYLDDNYVTLLPGEKRRIGGSVPTDDLLGETPAVRIRGWNVREAGKSD